MELPQELLESILKDLRGDPQSLKAAALVCRTFAAASQQQLFHKVRLDPPHSRQPLVTICDKFHSLLTQSPHIAGLVRELDIDIGDVTLPLRTQPWISSSAVLPSLLQQLYNLQSFSLIYEAGFFSNLKWHLLPEQLRLCLVRTLQNIGFFALGGISFDTHAEFAALFEGSKAMTELSLRSVSFPEPDTDALISGRPSLQVLHAMNRSHRRAQMSIPSSSLFDFSQLHEIFADVITAADAGQVWQILSQCSRTLRHLKLYLYHDSTFMRSSIPDLKRIQILSFTVMIKTLDQLCERIEWLVRLCQCLEDVEEMDVQFDFMFVQTSFSLDIPQWALLDQAFAHQTFSCLRKVNIQVHATRDMWRASLYAKVFPALRSAGLLGHGGQHTRRRI